MLRFEKIKTKPKHFQTLTGLKVEEFEKLVSQVRLDWIDQRIERLNKNNPCRKRKIGGGRKRILNQLEDQLLLTLIWAKLYPSYLVLEYLFGLDESTVCRIIHEIKVLLQGKFIIPDPQTRKGKKITSLEELKELIPDLEKILIDVSEQPIPRPEKKRKRKEYYSGKKKRFTIKTQVTTNEKGIIIHLNRGSPGRKHDYKIFKESKLPKLIPKKSKVYADSGYQGIQKDYPDFISFIPHKRSKKHPKLTRSEKIQNTKQRKIRIKAEHTLSQLKKYQVLSQVYRNLLQNYDLTFGFVANIVNFRMLERLSAS